jgi:phenylacetate-CoA ligase
LETKEAISSRGGIFIFYLRKYLDFIIRKILDIYIFLFHEKIEKRSIVDMLEYCSENIEFYRNKGTCINNYDFIDKKTVISNFDTIVKKIILKHTGYTSGTTGTPCKLYRDIHMMAAEQYFQNKYFEWKNTYRVIFRGEKLFKIGEVREKIYKTVPLIKEMHVSTFHVNEPALKQLVSKLREIPGKCLWAYPSTAYELAKYCLANKEDLEFDIVATSSEVLLDFQIEVIEKAFKCKIKDWYGLAERTAALYRCDNGHYHEVDNYSFMEYLPKEGNTCEIAGTSLHNRIMPLVRYKVHDLFEITSEQCACGKQGVNITRIHGRAYKIIKLPNFSLSETLLNFVIKKTRNIEETQIVQTKDGNIIFNVVKNPFYDENDEKLLLGEIEKIIPMEYVSVKYVGKIERSKSGKFQFVVIEQ